jgi:hypothetical protein
MIFSLYVKYQILIIVYNEKLTFYTTYSYYGKISYKRHRSNVYKTRDIFLMKIYRYKIHKYSCNIVLKI